MNNIVRNIVKILESRQAEEVRVIDINEITTIADQMIIASAKNSQHLNALVDYVVEEVEKNTDNQAKTIEGNYTSGWVLIDFGDVLLNLFDREQREYYSLDKLWKDGKEIKINEILGEDHEDKN